MEFRDIKLGGIRSRIIKARVILNTIFQLESLHFRDLVPQKGSSYRNDITFVLWLWVDLVNQGFRDLEDTDHACALLSGGVTIPEQ